MQPSRSSGLSRIRGRLVDILRRLRRGTPPGPEPPEPLTPERIDASYRLFWTKIALEWEEGRRGIMAQRVQVAASAPDFENNLLERRFRVDGLDDQAHSGASLLALLEVLRALDAFDAGDEPA